MSEQNHGQQRDTPDFVDHEPAADRLDQLTCPINIMIGDQDTVGMQEMARTLAEQCRTANLQTVPDTAHLIALERPTVVAEALTIWLRERVPAA
ncbi:MAG: alpha/beta hydrolase [Propionibacteriales bacterium]|nr:alpha/beta hydrolase [Propionibacteriales bacterium]